MHITTDRTPPRPDLEAAAARAIMAAAGVGGAEIPHHPTHVGRDAAWSSALVVFAGPGHHDDLPARLRARGIHVEAIDTKIGGYRHDVLRDVVSRRLLSEVRAGVYDSVFVATPCASYSIAHRPQLRSRRKPMGVTPVPEEWRLYLDKHNRLGTFTAALIGAAHAAGAAWAVENPADRGDPSSPAFWEQRRDHAPLWMHGDVAAALDAAGGACKTFAQCAFGSPCARRGPEPPASHPSTHPAGRLGPPLSQLALLPRADFRSGRPSSTLSRSRPSSMAYARGLARTASRLTPRRPTGSPPTGDRCPGWRRRTRRP